MSYKKEVIISLKDLKLISKDNKEIIVKAKFGPSKETKIPLSINEELSCLVAAIIGDGHLKKSKIQLSLDGFDKSLINKFKTICKNLFNINFNVTTWVENKKDRYCLRITNKAIYNLFEKVFKIPSGKKSNIVKIPKHIKKANKSIKSAFLVGIMVTEGGKRRRGFGLSTSSKKLWEDLSILFKDIGVKISLDKWIYKKYQKEYYGISFKKYYLKNILDRCKDKKVKNILINCRNFQN